jgi:hypothetical protein
MSYFQTPGNKSLAFHLRTFSQKAVSLDDWLTWHTQQGMDHTRVGVGMEAVRTAQSGFSLHLRT